MRSRIKLICGIILWVCWRQANAQCTDNSTFCAEWTKNGFCNNSYYSCENRVKYCSFSCNVASCSPQTACIQEATPVNCSDNNTMCSDWASNGFCNNTFYTCQQKQSYCGQTCNIGGCSPQITCALSTTSDPPNPCIDSDSRCSNWIANGFCNNNFYTLEYKLQYCSSSCNIQSADPYSACTGNTECVDSAPRCQEWAQNGFCQNSFYNTTYRCGLCPQTCGLCTVCPPPASTTARLETTAASAPKTTSTSPAKTTAESIPRTTAAPQSTAEPAPITTKALPVDSTASPQATAGPVPKTTNVLPPVTSGSPVASTAEPAPKTSKENPPTNTGPPPAVTTGSPAIKTTVAPVATTKVPPPATTKASTKSTAAPPPQTTAPPAPKTTAPPPPTTSKAAKVTTAAPASKTTLPPAPKTTAPPAPTSAPPLLTTPKASTPKSTPPVITTPKVTTSPTTPFVRVTRKTLGRKK